MTLARDFLQKRWQDWPRLPDSGLDECNDQEKVLIRGLEEHAIQAEFVALSDIILNCQNKFQFAKTYKVLRADLRKTFADPNAGNPRMPAHVNSALRQAFIKIGETKLRCMAEWFYITMADDSDRARVGAELNNGKFRPEAAIEPYAGKAEGCALTLLLLAFGLGSPLAYLMLF